MVPLSLCQNITHHHHSAVFQQQNMHFMDELLWMLLGSQDTYKNTCLDAGRGVWNAQHLPNYRQRGGDL